MFRIPAVTNFSTFLDFNTRSKFQKILQSEETET